MSLGGLGKLFANPMAKGRLCVFVYGVTCPVVALLTHECACTEPEIAFPSATISMSDRRPMSRRVLRLWVPDLVPLLPKLPLAVLKFIAQQVR